MAPIAGPPGFKDYQSSAVCQDGPYTGQSYALRRNQPIVWLGRPGQPYRATHDDESGLWVYVYADSIDDTEDEYRIRWWDTGR